MANMSYVRFENTLKALQDCAEHIHDENLSPSEDKAREDLIDLCVEIAGEFEDEFDLEEEEETAG